jgi:endonuclease-3
VRLDDLLEALQRFYGALPPPPRDPFTLFAWEVLSVHSMPRNRDASLAALKRARVLTPDALWRAPQKKLEDGVRIAGAYTEQRLDALKGGADIFRRRPSLPDVIRGPLRAARRALQPLPQLGDAGARRMLLFAADHLVFPADAGISRVGRRLGYGEAAGIPRREARSVHNALTRELPRHIEAYRRAYLYLSHHSASTCTDREPHCAVCPLLTDCPYGRRRALRQDGLDGREGQEGRDGPRRREPL